MNPSPKMIEELKKLEASMRRMFDAMHILLNNFANAVAKCTQQPNPYANPPQECDKGSVLSGPNDNGGVSGGMPNPGIVDEKDFPFTPSINIPHPTINSIPLPIKHRDFKIIAPFLPTVPISDEDKQKQRERFKEILRRLNNQHDRQLSNACADNTQITAQCNKPTECGEIFLTNTDDDLPKPDVIVSSTPATT